MEKKKIDFKQTIDKYFGDKKKRPLATLIVILPFLILIGIFGFKIYQQAKTMIGLASDDGGAVAISNAFSINDNSFVLRDNATDVQKEYFAELKNLYENAGTAEEKAMSTVKNFVADFYTWSNKAGQYDVGGMYYVYAPQRKTIYIQARDQFYKYINNYINQYGKDALLEVESVETTLNGGEFEFDFDEQELSAYKVTATWTYVQKEGGFSTSGYETKAYFVVVNNNERFEITYMGNEEYHAK